MLLNTESIVDTMEVGDLVFIWHRAKPTKTGWWRYVGDKSNGLLVLEKPMHKDFEENDPIFRNSRKVKGNFVMSKHTLKSNNWADKYNVLFIVRGVLTVELINKNYSIIEGTILGQLSTYSLFYTKDGYNLIQELLILKNGTTDELKKLAKNLI